jgi:hypothetical protein
MPSAPEHADALLRIGIKLPPEQLDALAFRRIDRCVRVHSSRALDAAGAEQSAAKVRALPELVDRKEGAWHEEAQQVTEVKELIGLDG